MMKAFKILFLALFALVSTQSVGQQQLFLNQTGGAPPTAGLLDQYKGAAFAAAPDVLLYSTYSATDDIAGSLTNGQVGQWSVAVFRDFDDAIKSFTPAEVADGTANTWVQELGPSDGFVRRWYDQSVTALDVSNLNHAEQSDPTKMPKLFDSSTGLILENGKAALDFDGNDDSFNISSSLSALATSEMNSFEVVTTQTGNQTVGLGAIASPGPYSILGQGSTTYIANRSVTKFIANRFYGQQLFAMDTKNLNGWQNGNQINYTSTITVSRNTDFTAIGRVGGDYAQMKMQVAIYYTSDQSTNRPGIETAINNEYSIYP